MPIVLRSSIKSAPVTITEESVGYCYSPRLFAAILTRLIVSPRLRIGQDTPLWFSRNVLPDHYCKRRPLYWKDADSYTLHNVKFCLACRTLHRFKSCSMFEPICGSCPESTTANGAAFYQAANYSEVVRSTTKEIRLLIEQELQHYAKNSI